MKKIFLIAALVIAPVQAKDEYNPQTVGIVSVILVVGGSWLAYQYFSKSNPSESPSPVTINPEPCQNKNPHPSDDIQQHYEQTVDNFKKNIESILDNATKQNPTQLETLKTILEQTVENAPAIPTNLQINSIEQINNDTKNIIETIGNLIQEKISTKKTPDILNNVFKKEQNLDILYGH